MSMKVHAPLRHARRGWLGLSNPVLPVLVLAGAVQTAAAQVTAVPVLPNFAGHAGCNGFTVTGSVDDQSCETNAQSLHSKGNAFYSPPGTPLSQNALVFAKVETGGFSTPPFAGVIQRLANADIAYF